MVSRLCFTNCCFLVEDSTVLSELLATCTFNLEITESYGIHYSTVYMYRMGTALYCLHVHVHVRILYYSTPPTPPAGTQTMLTFPMTFDLEKLVMVAYHGKATPTECLEEGEGRDVGNCSLRRKLFGQPERQVCVHCMCVCGAPGRYTYCQTVTVCP